MDPATIPNNPFAALTFIVAPALLTNTCSVLAMSTINRMLRTRERMHELFAKSEVGELLPEGGRLVEQVDRVEKQASLLLGALRAIYVALGAFAGATLATLLGASLAVISGAPWFRLFAGAGLVLGLVGVSGLALGSARLLGATRLSLITIREEAAQIRERHRQRKSKATVA